MRHLWKIAVVALFIIIAGCGGGGGGGGSASNDAVPPPTVPEVNGFRFKPGLLTVVRVGSSLQLQVEITESNGNVKVVGAGLSNPYQINFSSSNTAVAEIAAHNGDVIGKSTGTVTITANLLVNGQQAVIKSTGNVAKATIQVTVIIPSPRVKTLFVSPASVTLANLGDEAVLTVTAEYDSGGVSLGVRPVPAGDLEFDSSDSNVAEGDISGSNAVVRATGNGSATVTLRDRLSGEEASVSVTSNATNPPPPPPPPPPLDPTGTRIQSVTLWVAGTNPDGSREIRGQVTLLDGTTSSDLSNLSLQVQDTTAFLSIVSDEELALYDWDGGDAEVLATGKGPDFMFGPGWTHKSGCEEVSFNLQVSGSSVPSGVPYFWSAETSPLIGQVFLYQVDPGATATSLSSDLTVLDASWLGAGNANLVEVQVDDGTNPVKTYKLRVTGWYPGLALHQEGTTAPFDTTWTAVQEVPNSGWLMADPSGALLCCLDRITDAGGDTTDAGVYTWPTHPVAGESSLHEFSVVFLDEFGQSWARFDDGFPQEAWEQLQYAANPPPGPFDSSSFNQMDHPGQSWLSSWWALHTMSSTLTEGDFYFMVSESDRLIRVEDTPKVVFYLTGYQQ